MACLLLNCSPQLSLSLSLPLSLKEENSLLTIYKALVRSVVDYGSIVLDSASAAINSKIQSVHTEALRICFVKEHFSDLL
jgi:hypothetical protein